MILSPGSHISVQTPTPRVGWNGGGVIQSLIHVQLFATPQTAAHQVSLSFTISRSLLKLKPIESVMPSNHLILCRPLLLLPSIFPSIRVFSNESVLHIRWPEYWSFSFNISPSNKHPGPISYRMDWLDLLAVQGTLKSLLQHHSSKTSILQHSVFFMVQLSHPYMTTGKTIALTRQTFVSQVMSLLFSMLSRFVWWPTSNEHCGGSDWTRSQQRHQKDSESCLLRSLALISACSDGGLVFCCVCACAAVHTARSWGWPLASSHRKLKPCSPWTQSLPAARAKAAPESVTASEESTAWEARWGQKSCVSPANSQRTEMLVASVK